MQVLDQVNAVIHGKGWLFAYTGGGQVVAGVLEQDNSTLVMPLQHEELETVAMDRGICFFNTPGAEVVRVDG